MTILEMKLAAAGKVKQMRAIVDGAEAVTRDLNEDEQTQYAALKAQRLELNARIERAEELQAEETKMAVLDNNAHKPAPMADEKPTDPINSKEYMAAFASVVSSRRNQVPVDARAALTIGASESHFAVPEVYRKTMIAKLGAHNCLRQICNVITTTSTENIPVVTDNGAAGWVDELGTYPESDLTGERKVLGAHKLGRISKISEELLQDEAVNLETVLADAYAKSFGDAEETAMFSGNGVNKPNGLATQVTKSVEAAAVAAIAVDDLINLQHGVKRPYRAGGVWVMNDLTIAALRKLKNDKGEFIWQDGMREGEPDRLLGKPVFSTDSLAVPAASATSILFGDFKQGVDIGDRGTVYMQRLEELYAASGAIGFRMRARIDMVVKDTAAIAKLVHPAT